MVFVSFFVRWSMVMSLLLYAYVLQGQDLRLSVVYFLDPECKLCKSKAYDISTTLETVKNYSDIEKLNVYFVFHSATNRKKSKSFIKMFGSSRNKITPVFDDKNIWALKLNASVTPSVYLIDKNGDVIYSGALDDKDISVDISRKQKSISYIDEALKKFFSGTEIVPDYVKPVGCIFRF
jgi:thiol-disulfide isomerase/thioredoxin